MNGLVIIGCGAAKTSHRAPARALYTGPFFGSCRRAAEALAPTRGWYILSARHGLVHPDTELDPYDQRMGRPGSVGVVTVVEQARTLGLATCGHVVALAGRDYATVVTRVWPHALTPLLGMRGMGYQMGYLKRVAAAGHLHPQPQPHS